MGDEISLSNPEGGISPSVKGINPADLLSMAKMFEEFPHIKKRYWGRHFWSRGYFCVTAGELTKQMIEEYLVHHFEKKDNPAFEIER